MIRVAALALASVVLIAGLLAPSSALADTSRSAAQQHVREAPITFRLIVPGTIAPHMTFWVAYGPLAGHFGIVQLKRVGMDSYSAHVTLPIEGGSTFSYITGFGRMRTAVGYVPRRVGVTIKTVGPTDAITASARPVHWFPPIG